MMATEPRLALEFDKEHLSTSPIIKDTVARFGAERCLYGSHFPIEKFGTDYATLYQTFRRAINQLSDSDQMQFLSGTAARLCRF